MASAPVSIVQEPQSSDFADYTGQVWRAPLVPITLLVTTGIILDRYAFVQMRL